MASVIGERMSMGHSWNFIDRGKPQYFEKILFCYQFVIANPTRTDLGQNSNFCVGNNITISTYFLERKALNTHQCLSLVSVIVYTIFIIFLRCVFCKKPLKSLVRILYTEVTFGFEFLLFCLYGLRLLA
jgi:hypothetical protein